MIITLPISKSIANRLLILQAINGDPLLEVSAAMPEDIRVMHDALVAMDMGEKRIDIDNCGTAMRFLTAYASAMEGREVELTGSKRMLCRPIGALVDALREVGADIAYLGEEGYPPLLIRGRRLQRKKLEMPTTLSSQYISALLLSGVDVQTTMQSPYIDMTRACVVQYKEKRMVRMEADWSAAAFWYEYVALHPDTESVFMPGLTEQSLQGDKVVADVFASLGVATCYEENGVSLFPTRCTTSELVCDFHCCPDLYPAVAMTCHEKGIRLIAHGTEALPYKESDRLQTVQEAIMGSCCTQHDHRIAMALLAADREVDDKECIRKSYPEFVTQREAIRG